MALPHVLHNDINPSGALWHRYWSVATVDVAAFLDEAEARGPRSRLPYLRRAAALAVSVFLRGGPYDPVDRKKWVRDLMRRFRRLSTKHIWELERADTRRYETGKSSA